MAYFARIKNSIVTEVLAVSDAEEHRGQEFLADDLGLGGTWIQTSYNGRIRKNYAGIGYTYDPDRDAFIPPKPFSSWLLDEQTCWWYPPISYPDDAKKYTWDEETQSWVEVTE
jgi:hypothetical protein